MSTAFFKAKGRFVSRKEDERERLFSARDDLFNNGHTGDSREVIDLTRQIDQLDRTIESERKVLEKDHVKGLASAIYMSVLKDGYSKIRAVGRNANYNAVKSLAIATGHCKAKDINVCLEVSFDEGNIGSLKSKHHVDHVTAIMYCLTKMEKQE